MERAIWVRCFASCGVGKKRELASSAPGAQRRCMSRRMSDRKTYGNPGKVHKAVLLGLFPQQQSLPVPRPKTAQHSLWLEHSTWRWESSISLVNVSDDALRLPTPPVVRRGFLPRTTNQIPVSEKASYGLGYLVPQIKHWSHDRNVMQISLP